MSDSAPLTVIIHDCPEAQREAILDLFTDHGIEEEWGIGDHDDLQIGSVYGNDDVRLGTPEELADDLAAKAPQATWELWQDPVYEYEGIVYRFAPGLGLFCGSCTSAGEAYLTTAQLEKILAGHEGPDPLGVIRLKLGLDWLATIRGLKALHT